jgi:hypothetical protein
MDQNRILELALETLEKQRMEIDRAIAEIGELQDGNKRLISKKQETPTLIAVKRRSRTQSERKAKAQKMRQYWAATRAAKAKKPTPPNLKPKRASTNKAISEGMRAYWAKRKAEAAGKIAKTKPTANKAPKQPPKA